MADFAAAWMTVINRLSRVTVGLVILANQMCLGMNLPLRR